MSWSDLSTKLKQNVVGRLDLISRHALRCTSRSNRYLVNDMDFFVPRVRVSVKEESRILIMIHTGIDKFLRIEMWIGPHRKTIIRKFQNIYDGKECVDKVVPSIPRIHAARILCSLLSHKKLLIGTMEWEFDGEVIDTRKPEYETAVENWEDKIQSFVDFLQKFSRKSHVFRANQLMTTRNMIFETEELLRKMYDPSDLKKIERIRVLLPKESLTPFYSFDTYLPLRIGRIARPSANITHKYDEKIPYFLDKFVNLSELSAGFGVLRFAEFDDFARKVWDSVRVPVTVISEDLSMKMQLAESDNGDSTIFHMRSQCGYWIYMVLDSRRADFDAYDILNNSCGLGWLCKRCSDPFEYNYFQNLARQCVLEPEWNDMVVRGQAITVPVRSDRIFQKLAICITIFAFLSCAFYAIFF